MMSIQADTAAYEAWLFGQCCVVSEHLAYKHRRMRKHPFVFLRATYYRWSRTIAEVCPDLIAASPVLAVGDTHVENFGTWHDAAGRLVWGNNDFDEAAVMPWPLDLVRLAASARLAPHMDLGTRAIADAVLDGYRAALKAPRATLLDRDARWMQPFVHCDDADRRAFAKETDDYPDAEPPPAIARLLTASLPPGATILRFATRRKGGGSLGRPRYVLLAEVAGQRELREAKANVPSAWLWAHHADDTPCRLLDAARGLFRSPDPVLDIVEPEIRSGSRFVIRRIVADSRKVDLGDDPHKALTRELLGAMGFDLGSIHAATADVAAIERDIATHSADWLREAARAAVKAVEADYEDWQRVA